MSVHPCSIIHHFLMFILHVCSISSIQSSIYHYMDKITAFYVLFVSVLDSTEAKADGFPGDTVSDCSSPASFNVALMLFRITNLLSALLCYLCVTFAKIHYICANILYSITYFFTVIIYMCD